MYLMRQNPGSCKGCLDKCLNDCCGIANITEEKMLNKFYPALTVDKVQDINAQMLRKNNIKGLILDIDNTLVPTHVKDADEAAVEWIRRVKNDGFKACIVSNASRRRVVRFNERLQLHAIHRASKPGTRAFHKAARLMELKPENIAVIGDQIFTDVYGGNKAKMFTILVKPIHKKESVIVMLKRFPEKLVLKSYNRDKKN